MPTIDITDPALWTLPLAERMARLGTLREAEPFTQALSPNPLTGVTEPFFAVTPLRRARRDQPPPEDFCSGRGAVSIPDLPPEALEFFGSFINMDDPRHARQRGIVSRSFTPAPARSRCSTRSRRSAPR